MALEIRRLCKRYDNFHIDVSFTASNRETLVLAGPSGCGKTTVLHLIAGLATPDSGEIEFSGQDMQSLPAWQRKCGLVFQEAALFPHLSTSGNIAYGPFIAGKKRSERRKIIQEQLAAVRLSAFADRPVQTLSGGERQRVALARALAIDPQILLLDEPFSSLDGPLRRELWGEFKNLRANRDFPCLVVTHDRDEATQLGDRIALMRNGRIIEIGATLDLLLRPKTAFAAAFFNIGNVIAINKIEAHHENHFTVWVEGNIFSAQGEYAHAPALFVPMDAVRLLPMNDSQCRLHAFVIAAIVEGTDTLVTAQLASGQILRFKQSARDAIPVINTAIGLGIREDRLRIVETADGNYSTK